MNWTPSERSLVDFLLELINRGEDLIVLIQVFVEFVQQVSDILVNPMSVLELSHDVNGINIRHDFKAHLVHLKVIEKKQNDSDDLFFVEVIKDLGNLFNDSQL